MISIIVPAYNAEKYIEDCLISLCNQTYTDFELLVVDDGSKDKTKDIIEKYVNLDKRIKPFYNENHGVSFSRNFALKKAKGDYITFVDSDDIVAPDFLEVLLSELLKYNADMSAIKVIKSNVFNDFLFDSGISYSFKGEEIFSQLFSSYEGFLCNKLFKKSVIEKNKIILDTTINICEDLLFTIQYLECCKLVIYNSGVKYFYRQTSTSAFNNLNNLKWFDCLKSYEEILNLLDAYPNVKIQVEYNYVILLCEALYRIRYIYEGSEDLLLNINDQWKKSRQYFSEFNLTQKLKIILFRFFPYFVMKFRRRKLGDK